MNVEGKNFAPVEEARETGAQMFDDAVELLLEKGETIKPPKHLVKQRLVGNRLSRLNPLFRIVNLQIDFTEADSETRKSLTVYSSDQDPTNSERIILDPGEGYMIKLVLTRGGEPFIFEDWGLGEFLGRADAKRPVDATSLNGFKQVILSARTSS